MTDPLPAQIGPYLIRGVLGEGGMGVVYHGVHRDTGEHAAVKVAHPTDGEHVASIRREIHALRRVEHPGIVRILDDGIEGGLPWYAMALLQGQTLQQRLQALRARTTGNTTSTAPEVARTEPLQGLPAPTASRSAARSGWNPSATLTPLLNLIRRTCAPLAYLHGAGLVHRDLKPANIFLQQDSAGGERPVLVDLGIAVPFSGALGREELALGDRIGTIEYMAPEQIRGELVDARADLYAMGCILYECATGRTPFTGKDRAAIRNQHLGIQPLGPSFYAPGLPPAFERLVLDLLEKRPQDRPGHAADVAAALAALGAEAGPDEGPPPRAYLYRPELQGRAQAEGVLKSTIRRTAEQGSGGLLLVAGEAGVGKTRLAMEAARIAHDIDLQVITGRCEPLAHAGAQAGVTPPLQPFRPALLAAADRARTAGRAAADRLIGPRGHVLAPYEPSLLALPGQDEQPPPASLPPDAAQARVIDAVAETLRALAEPTPLLLVLDDLQWADELSLSVLTTLARTGLQGRGLMLLGTYRVEEPAPALASLSATSGVLVLRLDRLDKQELRAMVSDMLGRRDGAPWTVLDALEQHSRGNPFFVAEYLRAAIGEGLLRRDAAGVWHFDVPGRAAAALSALPLPTTLAELVERRLARLDKDARALAAWAAVLGQDLDSDLLLLGADRTMAMDALATLRERQILESAPDGRLRFVHDKIREATYAQIPAQERIEAHRRAGEALEALDAGAPDRWAAIGHHMARAEMHVKAVHYLARAAAHASEVYANNEAIRLYRDALAQLEQAPPGEVAPKDAAAILEGLGDVLALIGQQVEAREAYDRALAACPPQPEIEPARLHRKRGKTWEVQHLHREALAAYDLADEALQGASDDREDAWWDEWLHIRLDRVSVYYWLADVDRIDAILEAVQPVVERRGTPVQRADVLHALTQRNIQRERFVASAATVGYARECLATLEAAGDDPRGHRVLIARHSLAIFLMLRGALDEAEALMLETLGVAERTGDLDVHARCLTYLTMVQRRRGLVDAAERFAERSLALARSGRVSEYIGAALGNLAWVALSRGDHAEAERTAREALSCWQPLTLVYPFQWLARLPLAAVELARGHLVGAAAQATAVLATRQQRLPDPIARPLADGAAALAKGRTRQARQLFSRGLKAARRHGYM